MTFEGGAREEPGAVQVALNVDEVEFIAAWRMYRSGYVSLSPATREFLGQLSERIGLAPMGEEASPVATTVRDLPVYSPEAAVRIKEALPGVVFGGAVADSIGAPVEFDDWVAIKQKAGPNGVAGLGSAFGVPGSFTDDTQLLAFTLEGLIISRIQLRRRRFEEYFHTRGGLQMSYARWLHTQGMEWRETLPAAFRKSIPDPGGWLVTQPELRAQRSPDRDNLEAIAAFARATDENASQGISNFDTPLNQSKSTGALLRSAPAFLWSDVPERVFNLAADIAAMTHGHPTGYLPSGVLAILCGELARGVSLRSAIDTGLAQLQRWEGCDETRASIERALDLAEVGRVTTQTIEDRLGLGWRADEALAIGLAAALAAPDDYAQAVRIAVNRSGNSTTPAAVCGAIMGAAHGVRVVPEDWLAGLQWREGLEALVRDVLVEFTSAEAPENDAWLRKYPQQL
ncbi:ADP-ribosylglycohydrolase family protein [Saccharopolyspora sp. NPDC000359]|uniref:ADP-ribosylglycohydrolase family protein n=1 Tax=Saccharopolyspora sp. NPDC000359 TaxID=3154251 RepID=UPI003332A8BD